jgi:Flp pilus assembly protein TadG
MSVLTLRSARQIAVRFASASEASFAPAFAIMLVPFVVAVGAAVDYSRANSVKAYMQSALDTAILAGAKDGSSSWAQVALNVFNGNMSSKGISATANFAAVDYSTYTASAVISVPTSLLGIVNIQSLNVNVASTAQAADADNSCILTLDHGQPASHVSLKLNGAPIINLSNCSIRSNTSLDCNGHDGNVTKSYASGTATACGQPKSYQPSVPDIYTSLATFITTQCGSQRPGLSWTAGTLPPTSAGKFVQVSQAGYTEYHVCGDLTLSGNGQLIAVGSDIVIVIENGSLIIQNNASISTSKTAIVLTGDNNDAATIQFPNGNGKSATLSLSPPTTVGNPWQAVALFLDPKLTKNVDNTWGPGANFNADGLVYLGNSNVTTDGNTASNNSRCTKFVMNSFTTNGSVDLNFAQLNCTAIGLKEWGGIVVHLVKLPLRRRAEDIDPRRCRASYYRDRPTACEFITLLGATAAWPIVASAQQPVRMRRMGLLLGGTEDDAERQTQAAALRQGLRELNGQLPCGQRVPSCQGSKCFGERNTKHKKIIHCRLGLRVRFFTFRTHYPDFRSHHVCLPAGTLPS